MRSLKLRNIKNIEKENVDFEKYIETGYYCLDNLQNDTDKLCLAQFLRFIICFLEEPFNPRENKERIIEENPRVETDTGNKQQKKSFFESRLWNVIVTILIAIAILVIGVTFGPLIVSFWLK